MKRMKSVKHRSSLGNEFCKTNYAKKDTIGWHRMGWKTLPHGHVRKRGGYQNISAGGASRFSTFAFVNDEVMRSFRSEGLVVGTINFSTGL